MRRISAGLLVAILSGSIANADLLGPTPYLSLADSPIAGGGYSYFHLENFEDGALNTPGVAATAGVVGSPGALTDSVDADDGTIDGSGTAGSSWYSGNNAQTIRFDFDAGALGGLPTHAGLVWTDIGQRIDGGPVGFDDVTFTAFDENGVALGSIGPVSVGDGFATGGTAEDRFFGASSAGGISAIQLTMSTSVDWELDHLQYGRVPEPASLFGLMLGGTMLAARRRTT